MASIPSSSIHFQYSRPCKAGRPNRLDGALGFGGCSGSAPPFFCRPRELQPLLGKLEPRVFIERADRLLCLFEAFLSQPEEPIRISFAHCTRIMREMALRSFSFEPIVFVGERRPNPAIVNT